MKKVIVLGATGGMGSALVNELVDKGIAVTAFARNKTRLEKMFGHYEQIQIISGDVFNLKQLTDAVENMDVIFHAVNIPYQEWAEKQPLLMANILKAAKKTGAKLALVDNIYAYGRSEGAPINEHHEKNPHTKKGKIRLRLEQMAKESEVPLFIAHFPDFYGPNGNSLLNYTFENMVKNKRAMFIGNQELAREYIYIPDGAKAMVELAMKNRFDGGNWNITGSGVITGKEIIEIAREHLGYTKRVSTAGINVFRLLGIFDKFMAECKEMLYLTDEAVILDGKKYEKAMGHLPKTSYVQGIESTLKSIKTKYS
ncbi:SDR family NAD(P)-dependent oxidoreductase [Peribacillus sp. FSL H8-0477]|uniref:SDR family NAD(P)-dependent oxidoreductase n=1 Tax=Peribacillus sp. FSL H8-0477 TaxID=2921388 RepID=UPI0030FB9504